MNLQFETEVVLNTKGMQASKYDYLLEYLDEPGKTLYFNESDVKRQTASNIAKRMMILDPTRQFHSGFNVVKKKVYIRVRIEGEVPDKDGDADNDIEPIDHRPSDENGNLTGEVQQTFSEERSKYLESLK